MKPDPPPPDGVPKELEPELEERPELSPELAKINSNTTIPPITAQTTPARDFFGSLKKVNPAIGNSVKVADIIAFQVYIIRDMKKVYSFCQSNKHFTPEEIRYIGKVHTNMLFLCDANITELLTIINPDKTEMTDDERMMRIDKIYDDMLDKHAFVQSFSNDAQVLSLERTKEEQEIDLLKRNSDIL